MLFYMAEENIWTFGEGGGGEEETEGRRKLHINSFANCTLHQILLE
jgi:hypothetical protein